MNWRGLVSSALLALAAFPGAAAAAPSFGRGEWALSLIYPGIGVRVCALDFMPVEARVQHEGGLTAVGLRISRRTMPVGRSFAYYGLEYDYLNFETETVQGRGNYGAAFAGIETFIYEDRVSFEFDFGPAYLWMRDRGMSVSVDGIEYVLNFGFSYYFGRGEDGP